MNFSNYFNNKQEENTKQQDAQPKSAVEQILDQVKKQSDVSLSDMLASLSGDQAGSTTESTENMSDGEWFDKNYGDSEDFLFHGYKDLKEPYEDAIHKATGDVINSLGRKESPVVPAAAMVSSSKDLLAHTLIDGLGLSEQEFALRCAVKSSSYTAQMSSSKVDEQLINIFSALAAVDLLMSEIVATSIAENRIPPNEGGN